MLTEPPLRKALTCIWEAGAATLGGHARRWSGSLRGPAAARPAPARALPAAAAPPSSGGAEGGKGCV